MIRKSHMYKAVGSRPGLGLTSTAGATVRRALLTASCAIGLLLASATVAQAWTLSVTPQAVPRGGFIVIRSTSKMRVCSLTVRLDGIRQHYRLHRSGIRLHIAAGDQLGPGHVRVDCGDYYATNGFSIIPSLQAGNPTTPVTVSTPWTVSNVCQFNPGLGPVKTGNSQGIPYAYWTNSAGDIDLFAWSTDGNTSVDDAATVADGQITYIASCSSTVWTNVAVLERERQQSALNPASTATLLELDNIASEIPENPLTPDGPGCAGASAYDGGVCYVEPDDPY